MQFCRFFRIDPVRNCCDGDGRIGKAEFRISLIQELGMRDIPPADLDALFDTIDNDKSGEISFHELHRSLLRNKHLSAKRDVAKPPPPPDAPIVMPVELDDLRKQMKLDVLQLGARAAMRSAFRPDEEWARLGFPIVKDEEVEEGEEEEKAEIDGEAQPEPAAELEAMSQAPATSVIVTLTPAEAEGEEERQHDTHVDGNEEDESYNEFEDDESSDGDDYVETFGPSG